MKLINIKTNKEVKKGEKIISFRGEEATLLDFYSKGASSSGRVVVKWQGADKNTYEYYPFVFDCEIDKG